MYRSVFVTALVLLIAGGCRKENKMPSQKLVGMWNIRFNGADDNENGIFDDDERQAIPNPSFSYEFSEDGKGRDIGMSVTPIKWSLSPGNDCLWIEYSSGMDTIPIYRLSDDELILTTRGPGKHYYGVFIKQ